MADVLRIKRRASGSPGAPTGLANAEIAYNEVDHILYYGEGTGGAGGTASIISPIAGQGLGAVALPSMNSGTVGVAGTSNFWSKGDHVHPIDSSRAPVASPTFTGLASFVNITASGTVSAAGINSTPIGATTPSTGVFTALSATGINSTPIGATTPSTGVFTALSATNINSTPIGATTPSTGAFTTLSATGAVTGAGFAGFATIAAPTFTGDAKAVTPAVGDEDTSIPTTLFAARLSGGFTSFAAGDANVTLTALQMGFRYVRFTGALTADRTYTLPATTQRNWVVENLTTGGSGFNITFSIGTGVAVVVLPINMRTEIYTDGLNSVGSTQNLLSGNTLRVGDTGSNSLIVKVGPASTNTTSLDVLGTGLLQIQPNPLFASGLNFGSIFAPGGNADVSRHIALYGTIHGLNFTFQRFNYVAGGASTDHWFLCNGTDVASITATGINKAAIGATTPSTGAFTTLSASGAVTGAGFVGVFAPLASPVFTGDPRAVTVANTDSDTSIATTAFVHSVRQDQFAPPGADVSWNSFRITNLLDPGSPQDAATKSYVDLTAQGLDAKQPCRLASTANLTLSGLAVLDGFVPLAGDRILVKDQAANTTNGIYVAAAGAWSRATDADVYAELPGAFVFVEQGTVNADNGYVCTSDPGGTLGSTAITWAQFSGAGQVVAGAGLTKTGNQLDIVGAAARIIVNTDNIDIDAAYVGQASITTLGTIATGTWNATTLVVGKGGSGATTLTGYLKGNGTTPFTASTTIPTTDITGLQSMAFQNAGTVAITGGAIDGITFDMGSF